jgi:single-stranded DNA-binding protein
MSQLEAAVSGTCITEPALRRSQKGMAYLRVLLAVGEGDARQFCWACCFGDVAERVAGQLKRGGKLYAEGALTSEIYEREGKPTVSLNVAARRCEVLNLIGKQRPKENRQPSSGGGSRENRHPQHERPFDDEPFDHREATR